MKKLHAACGVMITASHNPKDDNGYKVYWENAVQIIAPHDKGISLSINENLEPRHWSLEPFQQSTLCIDVTDDMKSAYYESLSQLNLYHAQNNNIGFNFTNTSLHGVSDPFVTDSFARFGFHPSALCRVSEQQFPDPDFPSVTFPNPEEKGALDLAMRTADLQRSLYILAQDPDSDRFSAAEKGENGWIIFTGDQLGALFAARILQTYKDSGKPLNKVGMVASTVSSKMLEKMAQIEGFTFVECLTGFKYIGNTALSLESDGYEVPFGYEEAIGYMFGSDIRDKDGVAATMVFAELAAELDRRGTSVTQYLIGLYQRYGYYSTSNSYYICRDPRIITQIFDRIRHSSDRKDSTSYPTEVAGLHITSTVDLTTGYDSTNPPSYVPRLPLSSGQMIQFRASRQTDGVQVVFTLRTSGTEPKIKYYIDASGLYEQRNLVDALLVDIVNDLEARWLDVDKHNLGRP